MHCHSFHIRKTNNGKNQLAISKGKHCLGLLKLGKINKKQIDASIFRPMLNSNIELLILYIIIM